MHDEDLSKLDLELQTGNLEVLREIIRQGELFLESQLQSGIASDQRAVTFAAVVGAVAAVLIGGYVTVDAPTGVGWVLVPVVVGLLVSMVFAIAAARPVDWGFPGNNPKNWRDDIVQNHSLERSLAEQAKLYSICISQNKDALIRNSGLMRVAFIWSGSTLVYGAVAAIVWSAQFG